jgi:hypothetical protein
VWAVYSFSTDYADVSWRVPAVSMTGATFAPACAAAQLGSHRVRREHDWGKGMTVADDRSVLTKAYWRPEVLQQGHSSLRDKNEAAGAAADGHSG